MVNYREEQSVRFRRFIINIRNFWIEVYRHTQSIDNCNWDEKYVLVLAKIRPPSSEGGSYRLPGYSDLCYTPEDVTESHETDRRRPHVAVGERTGTTDTSLSPFQISLWHRSADQVCTCCLAIVQQLSEQDGGVKGAGEYTNFFSFANILKKK